MKSWREYFQDCNGDYSMTRLLLLGTWFVSSIIMLWLSYGGKMSEGYMTMYLGIPAISYGFSKNQDSKVTMATAVSGA